MKLADPEFLSRPKMLAVRYFDRVVEGQASQIIGERGLRRGSKKRTAER